MSPSSPYFVIAIAGVVMTIVGGALVVRALRKHGGLDRSMTGRVVFGDDSPMLRPEARGDRLRFRAGVFLLGFGLMNLFAVVTVGDRRELGVCVKMCRQAGYSGGQFAPSGRDFDPRTTEPLRGCYCTGPAGSVELTPARAPAFPSGTTAPRP